MAFLSVPVLGIEVTGDRAAFTVDRLFTAARASMAGGTLTTVVAAFASSTMMAISGVGSMLGTAASEVVPSAAAASTEEGMAAGTGKRAK